MNDFTVAEARDVLIREHSKFTEPNEARKYVYRQLLWGINKNILKRTDKLEGGLKKVLYSKTEAFFALTFVPAKHGTKQNKSNEVTPAKFYNEDYQTILEKELIAYEIDLTASFEEAKEYKRLSIRFPRLKEDLMQYRLQAKKESTLLLGRVNALQKLLGHKKQG